MRLRDNVYLLLLHDKSFTQKTVRHSIAMLRNAG